MIPWINSGDCILDAFGQTDSLGSRTEYNGSVFEKEIRQIGAHYRTRQTIISPAVEHKTMGQYLEKRIDR
ncbi:MULTISPECIES: phycobiliprotein lyase [unclassified Microcoleus]|uniref:phycobiliprotein lyase n=1 Tax=unclassified Microcoleus TaxID=2642155 RepID=UPI00403F36CC